eukprot:2159557-Amphidinium_carterae.1
MGCLLCAVGTWCDHLAIAYEMHCNAKMTCLMVFHHLDFRPTRNGAAFTIMGIDGTSASVA